MRLPQPVLVVSKSLFFYPVRWLSDSTSSKAWLHKTMWSWETLNPSHSEAAFVQGTSATTIRFENSYWYFLESSCGVLSDEYQYILGFQSYFNIFHIILFWPSKPCSERVNIFYLRAKCLFNLVLTVSYLMDKLKGNIGPLGNLKRFLPHNVLCNSVLVYSWHLVCMLFYHGTWLSMNQFSNPKMFYATRSCV